MYSVDDIKELANKLDGTDNDISLINELGTAVNNVYMYLSQEKAHFVGVIDYGDNCGCEYYPIGYMNEYDADIRFLAYKNKEDYDKPYKLQKYDMATYHKFADAADLQHIVELAHRICDKEFRLLFSNKTMLDVICIIQNRLKKEIGLKEEDEIAWLGFEEK